MQKLQWRRLLEEGQLHKLFLIVLATLILCSCAVSIPNIEAVSPVAGIPGVAAIAQNSNDDGHRRLNINEWMDFLYARGEILDPADPLKKRKLAAKGPSVCVSSEDFQKNQLAIDQLCNKGHCSWEQKKALERIQKFRAETSVIPAKVSSP